MSLLNLTFIEGLELAESPLGIFADTFVGLSESGAIVLYHLWNQLGM